MGRTHSKCNLQAHEAIGALLALPSGLAAPLAMEFWFFDEKWGQPYEQNMYLPASPNGTDFCTMCNYQKYQQ
jgi:hypothetical protein